MLLVRNTSLKSITVRSDVSLSLFSSVLQGYEVPKCVVGTLFCVEITKLKVHWSEVEKLVERVSLAIVGKYRTHG